MIIEDSKPVDMVKFFDLLFSNNEFPICNPPKTAHANPAKTSGAS